MMSRVKYLEYIRLFATLLVVLGHSTFFAISTAFPGMGFNLSDRLIDDSDVHSFFSLMVSHIYTYHMPLFFALSGTVYHICIYRGKCQSVLGLIANKTKRLIIPYVLVTLLYNVPILYIAGFFGYDKVFINILLYFFGFGFNHLWFLIALFIIFIIVHIIYTKTPKYNTIIAVVVGVTLWIASEMFSVQLLQMLYFDRVLKYAFYFVGGIILGKGLRYDSQTNKFLIKFAEKEKSVNRFIIVLPLLLLFIVLTIGWHYNNVVARNALPLITILLVYTIAIVSAQRFQPLPRPSILTIFSSCKLANTSADT